MKVLSIALAMLFSLGLSFSVAAQEQKLRIATEGAYPPFNYVDDAGHLAGFDVDIARAICSDLGEDCSLVAVPWAKIIDGLVNGDYDLIVASMAYTPERAERMEF